LTLARQFNLALRPKKLETSQNSQKLIKDNTK